MIRVAIIPVQHSCCAEGTPYISAKPFLRRAPEHASNSLRQGVAWVWQDDRLFESALKRSGAKVCSCPRSFTWAGDRRSCFRNWLAIDPLNACSSTPGARPWLEWTEQAEFARESAEEAAFFLSVVSHFFAPRLDAGGLAALARSSQSDAQLGLGEGFKHRRPRGHGLAGWGGQQASGRSLTRSAFNAARLVSIAARHQARQGEVDAFAARSPSMSSRKR